MKKVFLTAVLWFVIIIGIIVWKFDYLSFNKQSATQQPEQTQQDFFLEKDSFMLGLTSLNTKTKDLSLPIKGTLPSWLSGTLLRVGPGKFEINEGHAHHWLDGFAMVHRFAITDGSVCYSNKLLKSDYYKNAVKTGVLEAPRPNKGKSFLSRCASAFTTPKEIYDNANVNIVSYGNQCVALTETPAPLAFDPQTLKTIKSLTFQDTLGGHFCCAHPHFDKATNQWINFFITYGNTSSYTIYTMKKDSMKRKLLTTIDVDYPAYMHSFAVTQKYIILTESPFVLNPIDLLFGDKSFLGYFTWKPENGTRFIVVDKETGEHIGDYITDAFFAFHHVNAFDDNDTITLDIPIYPDTAILGSYSFKNMCDPDGQFPHTKLERFIINLDQEEVKSITLNAQDIEMPRINEQCCTKQYHYVYGVSRSDDDSPFANSITKVDVHTNVVTTWQQKNCYPSEPIFVARPDAKTEDDGILLSVVLDVQHSNSFLLLLDAKNMEEIARASTPHHIPFTIHGTFYQTIT